MNTVIAAVGIGGAHHSKLYINVILGCEPSGVFMNST